jgi:hypothetical protein
MKKIFVLLIVTTFAPFGAVAEECPDTVDSTGDQDHDGIINYSDPCCLVASQPGDLSDFVCADPAGNWDLNGNGIAREAEGDCCVYFGEEAGPYDSEYCAALTGEECPDGSDQVACDDLLMYFGGQIEISTGVFISSTCGYTTPCMCFTIGDWDGDGTSWTARARSTTARSCPTGIRRTPTRTPGATPATCAPRTRTWRRTACLSTTARPPARTSTRRWG